jgi:three-Cys-motif partner protein
MHQFGGDWTEDKLDRIRKYLPADATIFRGNPAARYLTTVYVDAFAGTGYRVAKSKSAAPLFGESEESEARRFLKGSARIALENEPPFDYYLFIEENKRHAADLVTLCGEFPHLAARGHF